MKIAQRIHRRTLLLAGAGLGAVLVGCQRDDTPFKPVRYGTTPMAKASRDQKEKLLASVTDDDRPVTAIEDLMREHGIVERVLLVYEAAADGIVDADASAPLVVLDDAARLVQEFVEDYHEQLEEEFVFPRFERAGQLVDLVTTLRLQHVRGRALTDEVRSAVAHATLDEAAADVRLTAALRGYARMYRAHAAREDTVVFPFLRKLVSPAEYRELGERFEEREHELFGARGFAGIVDRVTELERAIGIDQLAAQTA